MQQPGSGQGHSQELQPAQSRPQQQGAGHLATSTQSTQVETAQERKALELAHQVAAREEKHTKIEVKELETSAKEYDENLLSLKERVAAVTAELSQLKLNSSLTQALIDQRAHGEAAEHDPNMEITSFREVLGTVNVAFRHALKSKLTDADFLERLSSQQSSSRPEYCHVTWGAESADWKVHDPRDGTEVTFGALLQDVSRYWGLQAQGACVLLASAHARRWGLAPGVRRWWHW